MRLTIHPAVFRRPYDADARPRQYAPEFLEEERALAWMRQITFEHHARFGMAAGCRHASARNE